MRKAMQWCIQGGAVATHEAHVAFNVVNEDILPRALLEVEAQRLPPQGTALRDDEIYDLKAELVAKGTISFGASEEQILAASLEKASEKASKKVAAKMKAKAGPKKVAKDKRPKAKASQTKVAAKQKPVQDDHDDTGGGTGDSSSDSSSSDSSSSSSSSGSS